MRSIRYLRKKTTSELFRFRLAIIGVEKMPGAIAMNRIPCLANSKARGLVILEIAPFDAEYA